MNALTGRPARAWGIGVGLLLCAVALVSAAHAELPSGHVGLYFDRQAEVRSFDGLQLDWQADELGSYIDLPFYLLARDLPDGLRNAEFGLQVDPSIVKLTAAIFPEGTNFQQSVSDDERRISFTVSAGSGCVPTDGLVVLGEFEARFRFWYVLQVWLSNAIPSSLEPAAPGYVDCSLQSAVTWRRFEVGSEMVEISTPDPVGETAWGTLKATYSVQDR